MTVLLELFWSFFQIGALSFGGGMAAMPLIQNQIVELHGWLDMTDFANIVTIAEMTPGPIALNAATFVGTRVAGVVGALVATAGCVAPSCIIVLTLAHFYYKYRDLSVVKGVLAALRPAVVAMIATAGMSILGHSLFEDTGSSWFSPALADVNITAVILFVASFFVLVKWKPNPIYVMVAAGCVGLVLYQVL